MQSPLATLVVSCLEELKTTILHKLQEDYLVVLKTTTRQEDFLERSQARQLVEVYLAQILNKTTHNPDLDSLLADRLEDSLETNLQKTPVQQVDYLDPTIILQTPILQEGYLVETTITITIQLQEVCLEVTIQATMP